MVGRAVRGARRGPAADRCSSASVCCTGTPPNAVANAPTLLPGCQSVFGAAPGHFSAAPRSSAQRSGHLPRPSQVISLWRPRSFAAASRSFRCGGRSSRGAARPRGRPASRAAAGISGRAGHFAGAARPSRGAVGVLGCLAERPGYDEGLCPIAENDSDRVSPLAWSWPPPRRRPRPPMARSAAGHPSAAGFLELAAFTNLSGPNPATLDRDGMPRPSRPISAGRRGPCRRV